MTFVNVAASPGAVSRALGVRNYFSDAAIITLPATIPNFIIEPVPGGKLLTVDRQIAPDAVQIPEEVIQLVMATMKEMTGGE